jgi:hypothetical protein
MPYLNDIIDAEFNTVNHEVPATEDSQDWESKAAEYGQLTAGEVLLRSIKYQSKSPLSFCYEMIVYSIATILLCVFYINLGLGLQWLIQPAADYLTTDRLAAAIQHLTAPHPGLIEFLVHAWTTNNLYLAVPAVGLLTGILSAIKTSLEVKVERLTR